jgi:TonB family protein
MTCRWEVLRDQIELQRKINLPRDLVVVYAGAITGYPKTDGVSVVQGGAVEPGTRIRVSPGIAQGMVLTRVPPVYPAEAKAAKVQGIVVLQAIIATDGSVKSLHVINSASPLLDQAALDAVKQWKYRGYVLNGTPVEVDTQVTVNFTLAGQ